MKMKYLRYAIAAIVAIILCIVIISFPKPKNASVTPLVSNVFMELSDKVGTSYTYRDILDLLKENGYEDSAMIAEDIDPESVIIEDKDNENWKLILMFYPNYDGKVNLDDTLSYVSYKNDIYAITVTDDSQANQPQYHVFSLYRKTNDTIVQTKTEMINFLTDYVPDNTEQTAYKEATCDNEVIDVYINNVQAYRTDDGKVQIKANTNLPEGTKFTISLSNNDYVSSSDVTVDNSSIISATFSKDSESLLHGTYNVCIYMPMPRYQSESVINCIGILGEYIKGDLVSENGSINLESTIEI